MDSNQNNESDMDFEELSTLAQNDPESFEEKRLEMIESFFVKIPEEKQRRLRGLQWQIDQTRRTRTPMASCIAISNMMWDSLYQLNIHQRQLVDLTTDQPVACTVQREQVAATVLPFQLR